MEQNISSIEVKEAHYVDGYRLFIGFNNGKNRIVDFKPFLDTVEDGYLGKYKKTENFKNFNIASGNVVWGKDWDLIFPVTQLYSGKIKLQQ
jgi:hypothetical protein